MVSWINRSGIQQLFYYVDSKELSAVKEALHVSTMPSVLVCREDEQKRIMEFCKQCIEQEKAGSLYVCGCPGTGKSLSMENVKKTLAVWAKETGGQFPDILGINCTSLSTTLEIFNKILGKSQPHKKVNNCSTPLRQIQQLYSQKQQSSGTKMMQTNGFVFSSIHHGSNHHDSQTTTNENVYILMNVLFHQALLYTIFQPQALELCARKVADSSGDMRKALGIRRGAIERLETELRESTSTSNLSSMVNISSIFEH
uniref:AAA+ ATPase domain-containing protein n=1 Tax=Lactuca sativa TaxID=4236 RepID=A0A9R1V259_LACSA|nr:hypothetical protein LSAT_V11C700379020 [Lactuca sativa]